MYRQARERIIALEVMKLEHRQAMERGRRAHGEQQPTVARVANAREPSHRNAPRTLD